MNRTAMRVENDGAHCTQGACPAHMTDMAEAVCALDRALFKLTFEISYFTARLFTHIHDTSPRARPAAAFRRPAPTTRHSTRDTFISTCQQRAMHTRTT